MTKLYIRFRNGLQNSYRFIFSGKKHESDRNLRGENYSNWNNLIPTTDSVAFFQNRQPNWQIRGDRREQYATRGYQPTVTVPETGMRLYEESVQKTQQGGGAGSDFMVRPLLFLLYLDRIYNLTKVMILYPRAYTYNNAYTYTQTHTTSFSSISFSCPFPSLLRHVVAQKVSQVLLTPNVSLNARQTLFLPRTPSPYEPNLRRTLLLLFLRHRSQFSN